jgi:hypothetical protein
MNYIFIGSRNSNLIIEFMVVSIVFKTAFVIFNCVYIISYMRF